MPLIKVPFRPGFNNKSQNLLRKALGWMVILLDLYSEPENRYKKLLQTMVGVTRDIHNWADLDGTRYLAVASHRLLAIYLGGVYYDITPLDTALTSCT